MRKLHKLLAKEYIFYLITVLSALTITVFIFDLLEFADELINLPFIYVLKFIALRIPFFLSYTMFYSIILASVLSVLALSNRFELLVLFSSQVSNKRITLFLLLLISATTIIAFLNDTFLSPLCYRESMILVGKAKPFSEIELKDIAIKKNNGFIFIDQIEEGGKVAKSVTEITLDDKKKIKLITIIPMAEKMSDGWHIKNAYTYNDYGEKFEQREIKTLQLSDALINLAYKPKMLTLLEIKKLFDFSKNFNIDTSKYSHHISKLLAHTIVPIFAFLLFFKILPITVDDKKRIILALKLVFFLILYTIIEANIYNYAIANKLNALYPLAIISVAFLIVVQSVKRQL